MTAQWDPIAGGLQRRVYPSYEAYVSHQGEKVTRLEPSVLERRDQRLSAALRIRVPLPTPETMTVLCLGARTGAEVRVFRAKGYQAVGIDLQPGSADVLPGDFHALPFADQSFGLVYTNALDHAYDLSAVLSECRRVLMPSGILWVEAVRGLDEGVRVGAYESLAWRTIDALLEVIQANGFTCLQREAFDCPWPGEALVCR